MGTLSGFIGFVVVATGSVGTGVGAGVSGTGVGATVLLIVVRQGLVATTQCGCVVMFLHIPAFE